MEYSLRNIDNSYWITLLLVGCVILYAVSKYFYPRRFQEFTMLPLTNKYFLVQGRNIEIQHPFNLLLFIPQLICVSILIRQFIITQFPEVASNNPWLFLHICTGYTAFVLIKYFTEKIIGTVFGIETIVNQYLYQKLTYRNLLTILIFAFNVIAIYVVQPTSTIFLVFLGLVILLNTFTLFYSYKTNGKTILGNFFYFILYLCALEISPYLILYKVFDKQGVF